MELKLGQIAVKAQCEHNANSTYPENFIAVGASPRQQPLTYRLTGILLIHPAGILRGRLALPPKVARGPLRGCLARIPPKIARGPSVSRSYRAAVAVTHVCEGDSGAVDARLQMSLPSD